jgi:hypothetical protein
MSLQLLAKQMESKGRDGDSVLVHMTHGEVAGLQKLAESAGGTLTVNPETGLVEASFLKQMLPTLVGMGVGIATMNPYLGAAAGAAVGGYQAKRNDQDVGMGMLMGGLGGYGGASLGGSLGAAGAAGTSGVGMGSGAAGTVSGSVAPSTVAGTIPGSAANLTPSTLQPTAVGFTRDMMVGTPPSAVAPQMSMSTVPSADLATQYGLNSGTATAPTMAQNFSQAGQGFKNLSTVEGRNLAYQHLGGDRGMMRAGMLALAPAVNTPVEQQQNPYPLMSMELNKAPFQDVAAYEPAMPRFTAQKGNIFIPLSTVRAAEGGLMGLAKGGMKSGGFVVPADVVSMVGEGNTDAGFKRIKSMVPSATAIKGGDGGQADTVKTSIEGKQPARVAHGEMYIPPETVKSLGGAKKLYAMMDKVRQQATGSKKQIKPVRLESAMA